MKTLESLVAEKLLKIKAVKLQPANPFTLGDPAGNLRSTMTTERLFLIRSFVASLNWSWLV